MKIWSGRINFQAVLFSPYVLAVLPAIILLYALPLEFEKYEGKVVNFTRISSNQTLLIYEYFDLNGDSLPEKITIGSRADIDSTLFRIQVFTLDDKFRDEWVIKRQVINYAPVEFFDVDNNNTSEIYCFTQNKDSLFLNRLDPFAHPEMGLQSFFVDAISHDRNTFDLIIGSLSFEDYNKDGFFEFTFGVSAGYCRQPRRLYRFYPLEQKIEASARTGVGLDFLAETLQFDFDGDGKNEYLVKNSNVKNYSEIAHQTDLKPIDTCAWVLGYDDDFQFLFEPIALRNNLFVPAWVMIDKKPYFYYAERNALENGYEIIIRDWQGNIYRKFPFKEVHANVTAVPALSNWKDPRLIITNGKALFQFDIHGNQIRKIDLKNIGHTEIFTVDALGSAVEEYVINTGSGIYLADHDLKHPIFVPLPQPLYAPIRVSVISKTKDSGLLSINNNASYYELRYSKNPLYFWRHPIWFAVYLSVVLLLWLTQLLQKKQSLQKYEAERQLMAFRFRALKNQVDPHFTLNALNSIAQMQEQGQQENAGKFLVKFSRMIHRTLENSDKIETTLEEELDFVRDYLDVQQMRFRNAFSYEIRLEDEALNELPVPRHLVHTFVENALKHGLRSLENPGKLMIHTYRKQNQVIIEVDDNGIGREQASKNTSLSTGKGLTILDELIMLFKQLKNNNISYQILDKKTDSGKSAGTKIRIELTDHDK
ncbi:MAG: histidine kinase [Bacteroidetes bacterium]|jgi:hypothetical protein|nr:histidine kinase [Bacteroidota bacterium]